MTIITDEMRRAARHDSYDFFLDVRLTVGL
jgi:hypothetical protein